MKMSTRGRYCLRVMIDLAEHRGEEFIPLKDIALRQEVSQKYIEKLLPTLTKHGLVEAVHGKGGGYRLTRAPEDYRVGEILRLTEGELSPVLCAENGGCDKVNGCKAARLWVGLNKAVNDYLDSVALTDLL